jgi:hypothetical protein
MMSSPLSHSNDNVNSLDILIEGGEPVKDHE